MKEEVYYNYHRKFVKVAQLMIILSAIILVAPSTTTSATARHLKIGDQAKLVIRGMVAPLIDQVSVPLTPSGCINLPFQNGKCHIPTPQADNGSKQKLWKEYLILMLFFTCFVLFVISFISMITYNFGSKNVIAADQPYSKFRTTGYDYNLSSNLSDPPAPEDNLSSSDLSDPPAREDNLSASDLSDAPVPEDNLPASNFPSNHSASTKLASGSVTKRAFRKRVVTSSRVPNMEIPAGCTVVPLSDNVWIAFKF